MEYKVIFNDVYNPENDQDYQIIQNTEEVRIIQPKFEISKPVTYNYNHIDTMQKDINVLLKNFLKIEYFFFIQK
jgi:hypothetical protein